MKWELSMSEIPVSTGWWQYPERSISDSIQVLRSLIYSPQMILTCSLDLLQYMKWYVFFMNIFMFLFLYTLHIRHGTQLVGITLAVVPIKVISSFQGSEQVMVRIVTLDHTWNSTLRLRRIKNPHEITETLSFSNDWQSFWQPGLFPIYSMTHSFMTKSNNAM